jgi:hypothetical protein
MLAYRLSWILSSQGKNGSVAFVGFEGSERQPRDIGSEVIYLYLLSAQSDDSQSKKRRYSGNVEISQLKLTWAQIWMLW